ncbi:MAG TPA: GH1 family beta-glucosidase [Bacteroidales bacterium]|nr:GH1 family beta-glucosidase [Bacteroidales bacterium]
MNREEFLKLIAFAGFNLYLPSLVGRTSSESSFSASEFGDQFAWGTATASFQIEGAWKKGGKGESIWDRFSHLKGKIHHGDTAEVACDFFHRYRSDLQLMRQLNFSHFRFSLSWPRILPEGKGIVNKEGIDFYNRLIDACLELNIKPWVTLYHWDLPQKLEDQGGWTNRDVIAWIQEYADVCTKAFGDRVKNWSVLNEPFAFTSLGYMTGLHAPGKKGLGNYLPAVHHAAMAQAEGARIVRQNVNNAMIGSAFSCSYVDAKKLGGRHERAAKRLDALFNRLFIEPALGMGYPVKSLPLLNRLEPYIKQGDEQKLKYDFDFIGLQNYFRIVGKFSLYPPVIWANDVDPKKLKHPLTSMGWEVHPEGIYKVIHQFAKYPVKEIVITENGAAFDDTLDNKQVNDTARIAYFNDYLKQVLKAKNDGANVTGYFVWTLMDNFEWAEGYRPRFGLIYVDFNTLERYPKNSGYWFRDFLSK